MLAHTPSLARFGSKPARSLPGRPEVDERFTAALRSHADAIAYSPHQAYIGALHPRDLPARPWAGVTGGAADRFGPDGEVMPEAEFVGLMAAVEHFGLLTLSPAAVDEALAALARHPLAKWMDLERLEAHRGDAEAAAAEPGTLVVSGSSGPRAVMRRAHDKDEALCASVLLENLAGKATATLAVLHMLDRSGVDPTSIDYVLGCGEEAIGDRYQRGGGNMAKAVAEAAGLTEASGADIKDFCAAPVPALVIAASLVTAGVFERVAVVAGGSLPKLGMKFEGHLAHDLPVLEDVLCGSAALVTRDDGCSPRLRLDAVGRHRVSAGGSGPQIMQALAIEPLERLGLRTTDVDDYATELHNPEITEPQGSGDVAARNYKTLAALAARRGDIERGDIADFVTRRGMPGFAPTQGHLASALCYLPHATTRLTTGDAERVQLVGKGSLFLGRITQLSDGMSVLLERNERGG
ncbi:betaine reductase [Pseudonocardia saturnea]|uniref:Betaine reductase n=1 Tax=Pseudonocardia saturnea TaxID=33909 RepID=A0ABQ0S8P1_9PSEU|nr:betaine reductase [Pseudonocardia autotrophica]GEC29286.1 betaine reductase [Pseudonocardia saturnea]